MLEEPSKRCSLPSQALLESPVPTLFVHVGVDLQGRLVLLPGQSKEPIGFLPALGPGLIRKRLAPVVEGPVLVGLDLQAA